MIKISDCYYHKNNIGMWLGNCQSSKDLGNYKHLEKKEREDTGNPHIAWTETLLKMLTFLKFQ